MEAVVSASHGAFGPLLVKLNDLLAGEYARLKGVRREMRSLRSELSNMHAALQKYTMLQDPDIQVKAWISEVRELAYDTEDCVDKFIHRLGSPGARHHHHRGIKEFFRRSARRLKTLGSRRQIAKQIVELKARVMSVKDQRTSYKLDDMVCGTSGHAVVDPRLAALFIEEAHLMGIEDPRDDLAKEHFHCHAFVSVSQKPDVRKIIKDIISQVPCHDVFTKDIQFWDEKRSIEKLRELLQDKRYLVVIDDIWSTSAWNTIKCAFPENNCSSRVITTTRIFDVASSCCQVEDDRIYYMEPLSDLHSKKLFFNRIFGSEDCCPDILKDVSDAILRKCGGLPLAIISISGLLASRPAVRNEREKIRKSIGFALDKSQSLEGMKSILSLSYSSLTPNLKTCLLYFSNFPEDYKIERDTLVRRWIAEGFISEERGQSRQEVAENNFYELINKSIVQPMDIGYDGKARACRVHDLMLEFAISKAAEENFITVLGGQMVLPNSNCYIRRLSVQHINSELASTLASKELHHVRSLTVSGCIKQMPNLVEFESLRVLDFEGCEGLKEYDLNNINKLFKLKYLSLRSTCISNVPSGVVTLHDLVTLDLRDTYIQELPAGIVQLSKLQYLLTARCIFYGETTIPSGIGKMKSLCEISGFNITTSSVGAVEELENLTNLTELHVVFNGGGSDKYKRHEEMLFSSLCKLGRYSLQSFRIQSKDSTPLDFLDSWCPLPSSLQLFIMSTIYYLPKPPKWLAPTVTSLTHLNINLSEITEEDINILGRMPALISLELWFKTVRKERLIVQGNGFRSLKEFYFIHSYYFAGARYLLFEEGALPKVEKLQVPFYVSVAEAYGLYLGIEHLPCLKDAEVSIYNEGATASESKVAVVSIRNEANTHPNHPRVTILEEDEEDGDDDDPDDIASDSKKKGKGESLHMWEDELLCDA
ncbi:disease resistance protein Pik-2-like [Aegilops tauschii subsp. strangulata]|uniref:disease resistance protein Pik-2-like n=1 Tax=Aegilops tauschii subsp. strangulata TaxID=200361 RepID=UPI003CC83C44